MPGTGRNSEKQRGRPFPPGKSGNPAGRPKLPPEIKAIRYATAEELKAALLVLIHANPGELEEILKNPKEPVLRRAYARALQHADMHGDLQLLEMVHARTIGRPVQAFDFSDADLERRMAELELRMKGKRDAKK